MKNTSKIQNRIKWMRLPRVISGLCALAITQVALGDEPLTRIHFGSCVKQTQPMPIFQTIVEDRPEVFLMIGDNIYADTEDMDVMRTKYAQLNADPGFSLLRATCPILATWDDHDYGRNDGGEDYAKKREAQKIFSDFWGDPLSSPRRQRSGVYDAHVVGPEGRRVQIILLDTRYFRGPLQTGERRVGGPYYPNEDPAVTMLGEAQWQWLEELLKQPTEVRIIASSIQFIAEAAGQETWSNLPAERQRLIDLIARTKAAGVVFVSGDRHWSDLSVQRENVPYPLYDLTSSSLNQPHKRGTPTENQYRETDQTYHQVNFGVIEVDWSGDEPALSMRIQDLENQTRIQKKVALSELRAESR